MHLWHELGKNLKKLTHPTIKATKLLALAAEVGCPQPLA